MTVGITFGAWDLLHTGHVLMLEQAKENCDTLIVGLHVDPSIERTSKNKPIQTLFERYQQLKACRYVDQIIPYSTEAELEDILSALPVDIRFLGGDYLSLEGVTGREICDQRGISCFILERSHRFSTSELRNRIEGNAV